MKAPSVRLLVGGYTTPRGQAAGISVLVHDRRAATLELTGTVSATSPSALAFYGGVVFAVEETATGRVRSYRLDETQLSPTSTQDTGGADPCHLLISPSGRHLLTANYTSASIVAHPLDPTGTIAPASDLLEFTGCGPVCGRQESSHPHHIALRPRTDEIAVADLGADLVHRVRFDDKTGRFGSRLEPIRLPAGCGPRQVVFSAEGRRAFVLGELDSTVTVIDWSAPHGPAVLATSPALRRPSPTDNLAATLLSSDDSSTLYVSHRGADVVAMLSCTVSEFSPLADIPSGGRWPRHIAINERRLYIANERSHDVIAMNLADLTQCVRAEIPSPTFVLPVGPGRYC